MADLRIAEQSRVEDLRSESRDRAKQSLVFFLETVLGVRMPPELVSSIEVLQKRRLLLEVAEGTALWYRINKVELRVKPINNEAVSWLFPEVRDNGK